jgi:hypothetical protein
MNALERLNSYLRQLERALRLNAASRGAALTAGAALLATVLLVLVANSFAFSAARVTAGRILLALCLGLALGLGLLYPWLRVNRRNTAHWVERRFPEFQERLLTFAERGAAEGSDDPFLELLAEDTAPVAQRVEPSRVVSRRRIVAFASTAAAAAAGLAWLVVWGPGFLGYGASLLWAGPAGPGSRPFYDILVSPGNRTVRRGADQLVTAQPVGFQPARVRLLAQYAGTSKWEEALMQPEPQGAGFQFLFAGIPETADYYVEAGGVRSKTYKLKVIDLPAIRKIRVTYHFPGWTGLKDAVEDPGGDLRAVEGTQAEVAVLTDRPLRNGVLALDGNARIPLEQRDGNWLAGRVPIEKDGLYHVATNEYGEEIRLSEDFFIEARRETPPLVRIPQPGRDARVNPIAEVTIGVEAEDDFSLQDLTLRYWVNGGEEKAVPLLKQKGVPKADGAVTLYLEDFKLVPGDVVSFYASARDARSTSHSDILFIETHPFEREYSQSQQAGGGGIQGGGNQDPGRISARQKEIIAATWNEIRNRAKDKSAAAEDAKFLSDVQAKLRDQALSLAKRMASRQLSGTSEEFDSFSKDMGAAAQAMSAAADRLKAQAWREALPPEQRALQHLLRAEATFRQIRVAFGSRGGGGGAGGNRGAGRDLENLFDLELDMEKNQYETGQQAASGDRRAREVDEALQKLEQLARRQQELARQQRQQRQSFQQRWQQEMLRREAEELQRQMERLTRGESGQQSGQQGRQAQASEGGQQGPLQRSLRAMSRGSGGRPPVDPRLERALERLQQATRDMRGAGSAQNSGEQSEAEARRAAERLEEARQLLRGLRSQESSEQMADITRSAGRLAERQNDFANRLRQAYGNAPGATPQPPAEQLRQRALQFSGEKQQMTEEYQRLERQIQDAIRDLAGSQPAASSKLREALGDAQKDELALRMKTAAEWIRRGLGAYASPREAPVTQGLERLRDQTRQAQAALERGGGREADLERALAGLERLRSQMERATGGYRRGEFSAINRGDLQAPPERPVTSARPEAAELDRVYRQGLRDLGELRRSLVDNPELARNVQELIREMQRLDPKRFPGNPELVEQLRRQLLPALEQLELGLRRQLEDRGEQIRSGAAEPVPPGYADAVAEYFRRLSKPR